jgi:hypothetical protein
MRKAIFALLLALAGAAAQDLREHSGLWKLNVGLSRGADGKALALNKSHLLSIRREGGTTVWMEQRATADGQMVANHAIVRAWGKEVALDHFREGKLERGSFLTLHFEDQVLVQRFRGSFGPGKDYDGTRRMKVRAGGKRMEATVVADRFGEKLTWKEVWERL